jgi:hypothetical protein
MGLLASDRNRQEQLITQSSQQDYNLMSFKIWDLNSWTCLKKYTTIDRHDNAQKFGRAIEIKLCLYQDPRN